MKRTPDRAAQLRQASAEGQRGAVTSPHYLASQAGLDILRAGGSAVDAAIATNAALSVVTAHSCGLGGDAFWLIWDGARVHALNGSGRSAALATLESAAAVGLTTMPERGPWTVTVPGGVRSWGDAHERFGRLPWARLFDAAIELALGFPASPAWIERVESHVSIFGADGDWARTYRPAGRPWTKGESVAQPALADTLRILAADGPDVLYSGAVARRTTEYLAARGSPLRLEDLLAHESRWGQPIAIDYRDVTVVSHPPNSSGPIALEMLALLDRFEPPARGTFGPAGLGDDGWIHLGLAAASIGLAEREAWLTDPDAMAQDFFPAMLDQERLDRLAAGIDPERATSPPVTVPSGGGTVYIAAADADGQLVSMLESNFMGFGSGLVDPQTGIAFQNRGASFSLDPSRVSVLAPGKRTAHTLTPGMTLRGGRPWVAHGSMGGEIQPQIFTQFVSALVDGGLDIETALGAARWAVTLTPAPEGAQRVDLEEGFRRSVVAAMAERGWPVSALRRERWFWGHAHALEVRVGSEGQADFLAAYDPRSEGAALAW